MAACMSADGERGQIDGITLFPLHRFTQIERRISWPNGRICCQCSADIYNSTHDAILPRSRHLLHTAAAERLPYSVLLSKQRYVSRKYKEWRHWCKLSRVGMGLLECENSTLMGIRNNRWLSFTIVLIVLPVIIPLVTAAGGGGQIFLPLTSNTQEPIEEVRALWVTRFDWTNLNSASPQKIDEIVANAAAAGFNVLYFQIRGEADAYYPSDLEPWARRLSGTLGQDPGWDPLAYLVQQAHQQNLQVHAYLNVYPLWADCDEPPPSDTSPRHLYHILRDQHGMTDSKSNGLMWEENGDISCGGYLRVTPASTLFDDHLLAVTHDLVQRYDIDGLHLDHIRYSGRHSSCDPVSVTKFGGECFSHDEYEDWQRQQVNRLVGKLYAMVRAHKPHLWMTAAVWPVYRDKWGWGVSSGYNAYYQDSKSWLAAGTIDGIAPMIYTGSPNCDQPYFWSIERWQILVQDYVEDSQDRMIIPGIGTRYCTSNDFDEIRMRIEMGRALGTAGHALYSYRSLLASEYFDDLAQGPYRVPAILPELPRH